MNLCNCDDPGVSVAVKYRLGSKMPRGRRRRGIGIEVVIMGVDQMIGKLVHSLVLVNACNSALHRCNPLRKVRYWD